MRQLLLALVLVAAAATGLWFRGAGHESLSLVTVLVLSLCVLAADLLGPPKSRNGRMVTALLAGGLFAVGWHLGGRDLEAALTDAARNAEVVRAALEEHRRTTGAYPESLRDLDGVEIPGKQLLRGTVLRYIRTRDGYVLWFDDSGRRFSATHEHELSLERSYE
jgi:hypothetical protein